MQNALTFHEQTALGFAKKATEAKDQSGADWFMRQAVCHADKAGASLEALEAKASAIAAQNEVTPFMAVLSEASPVTPVCSVKAIRRFFAICKAQGIDASNEDRTRGALSAYFGRRIASRKELSTEQWLSAGDAIERRELIF